MIRKILSVIIGYAIFVVASLAFFKLMGKDPHVDPSYKFMMATAVYGTIISFLAGFITPLISKAKDLKVNIWLAFIIAGFATFSYFKAEGNHWTQILAIFVFTPASILGGLFYTKKYQKA